MKKLSLLKSVSRLNKNLKGSGYELIVTTIPGVFLIKKEPKANDVLGLLALFHLSKQFDLLVNSTEGLQLLTITGDVVPQTVSYQAISTKFGYGATIQDRLTISKKEFIKLQPKLKGAEMVIYCIYRQK